jgi:type II secretory pathway component PulK
VIDAAEQLVESVAHRVGARFAGLVRVEVDPGRLAELADALRDYQRAQTGGDTERGDRGEPDQVG